MCLLEGYGVNKINECVKLSGGFNGRPVMADEQLPPGLPSLKKILGFSP